MTKSIKFKRLLWGLILFFGSIFIISKIEDPTTSLYFMIPLIIGLLLLIFCRAPNYYCADCGQWLGSGADGTRRCERCGCNVYTEFFDGVGQTSRHKDRF